MARTLVVIPAYNEESNLPNVILELRNDFSEADILVVDDCSTDATADVAVQYHVTCVSHPFNMGYSHSLLTGFKYASMNNYDVVVQFDGDGQHIANEAKILVDVLTSSGSDIVIGSRFMKEIGYKHPIFRKLGTLLFRCIIRISCKTEITDPTSGLQALTKDVFTRFARMQEYPEYPDANLIIDLLLNNYRIIEYPVEMRQRISGTSMHGGIWRPVRYMMLMLYSILLILIRQRRQVRPTEMGGNSK